MKYFITTIALAGGVSANSGLRHELLLRVESLGWQVFIPEVEYCTDNAAMVAMAAHYKFLENIFADMSVAPAANLPIQ